MTAGAGPPDQRMTLQNLGPDAATDRPLDQQSASSSTSSKRRNSNLRKLLDEIKTSSTDASQSHQKPFGKPPMKAQQSIMTKPSTDLSLDTDLAEL